MVTRIEVWTKITDSRAKTKRRKLASCGFTKISDFRIVDEYTIDKNFSNSDLKKISEALTNPVTQESIIRIKNKNAVRPEKFDPETEGEEFFVSRTVPERSERSSYPFDWTIEIGFLPGVTDNIAGTVKEIISDLTKATFNLNEGVYSSQAFLIKGFKDRSYAERISQALSNNLIQRVHLKSFKEFLKDGGMDFTVPKVKLEKEGEVLEVDLNVSDSQLLEIGRSGIIGRDGKRRGPLALSLIYLKTIRKYFQTKKRNPTDIEIESLAQTWSEHCKHTIFTNPIDELSEGLYKTYIKKATDLIRKRKKEKDFCVSVFRDNSGAISFNEKYLITHKVETHNTPSALNPFGGSITGIVGVNRDTLGFGLAAKPIANFYGFCFANPYRNITLYRNSDKTSVMLSSRRIMEGVIEGINAGGNQSGIPTPLGFLYFNEGFRGKPLVFAGTIGLIPKKIKGRDSFKKKAKKGDYIVMIGGRVGKDGIHGATFSSESLHEGSPQTAVQIGDPITQKKFSDVLIFEAREEGLYNSITDNGAGGLSCSVSEMAKESGGFRISLEKVPLKYPGLDPWEIWISESQERMTLAVPPKKWNSLNSLLKKRGVEGTVIGEFTDSGKCEVLYDRKKILDLDMEFLHNGLPKIHLKTREIKSKLKKGKSLKIKNDYTHDLLKLLSRQNCTSFEFVSKQYDYIVQGNSVLPPLQGRGRINGDVSVIRPDFESKKALLISYGLYPRISDIDSYKMAAASIDTVVRNIVAAGGDPDFIAILDNFCWCSSDEPERLYQLKEAVKACFDIAVSYNTPFISGKDSMFNDFSGFDNKGKRIKISIPPTLLISSIGVISDYKNIITMDAYNNGDLIYLLGETRDELIASEYFDMLDENEPLKYSSKVPEVFSDKNKKLYSTFYKASGRGLISSSVSLNRGGLAYALAKLSMSGKTGISISLARISQSLNKDYILLFSESQGRVLVTVNPKNKKVFEKLMQSNNFSEIGFIQDDSIFEMKGVNGKTIIKADISELLVQYRKTFADF